MEEVDLLRRYLAGRDVACPMCGYNLRDLLGDRCPECGDQLELVVSPLEPKQAAVITGLVLLSAGTGLNGLLLIYWVYALMHRAMMGPILDRFLYANAVWFAVEGSALAIWIGHWKTIRRLGPASRWLLAVGCCGFLMIAGLFVFTISIR